jgi:alpha-glucosidase
MSRYRFVKVEDFFQNYRTWACIVGLKSWHLNTDRDNGSIDLILLSSDGTEKAARLEFIEANLVRLRFNPNKKFVNEYTRSNSRTIVMDTMEQLRVAIEEAHPFTVEQMPDSSPGFAHFQSSRPVSGTDRKVLGVAITGTATTFKIVITDLGDAAPHIIFTTHAPCLYFQPNGTTDSCIAFAVEKPATARYVGFGEQGGKEFVKNTDQLNFFNFDNMRYKQVYNEGPLDNREPLYHSDPFFVELNGNPGTDCVIGTFIDNPAQIFVDIGYLNSSRYLVGTRFGDLDVYLIAGCNSAEVLQDFVLLVGHSRLKPRYALGYHQGCYGYENWSDIYTAVNSYRSVQIPIDGIHVDVDIQHRYQTFTVDQGKFPNAQATFADLRSRGIKCSTNITPIISNQDQGYQTYTDGLRKGYFVADVRTDPDDIEGRRYQNFNSGSESHYTFTDPEGNFNSARPYVGEVYYGGDRGTTGHYPDLARSEVRKWWGTQYQHLFDLGLEMVWQDMTTPAVRETRGDMRGLPFRLNVTSDFVSNLPPIKTEAIRVWNLYSYNLHKATYHGLNALKGRENKRNFIVGRGSFTGMHRFAALWTGDNASTWDFLRMNVAQVLSLGMSGLPVCGQDIGGFESESDSQKWVGPELLMRWTAVGAFLPWFRNHYIRKGAKLFQEPYAYASVDLNSVYPVEARRHYGMVLPVCRFYIERRYRLLQLIYDAMFENTLTGLPICRSMILTDSQDKALYNDKANFLDNQFMVRHDLLVAPLLEPESNVNAGGHRDIYLPANYCWYCFMDNRLPLPKSVEGGTTIRGFDAGLYLDGQHIGFILPMYVRAGAVLPTIELEQYVGERNRHGLPNPITYNLYPGANGSYTAYLDDGVSRSSAPKKSDNWEEHLRHGGDPEAKGEFREVLVAQTYTNNRARHVSVTREHDGYTPPFEKYFFLAFLHDPAEQVPNAVQRAGNNLRMISGGSVDDRARQLAASDHDAWYYNENLRISFVKIFDDSQQIQVDLIPAH